MSTDAQAIVDVSLAAAVPAPLDKEGRFFTIVIPGGDGGEGSAQIIDVRALEAEADLLDKPRRKTGTYVVHDASTFCAYVKKHGDEESEVWADLPSARVTAVLNAHESGDEEHARHEDHRVAYAVLHTEAWKAWIAKDGVWMKQRDFAEHVEERALDIVKPTAGEMLEIAQSFQASIGVTFASAERLSTGERQLTYHETVDGKAGRKGQLSIPEVIELGLQPFEGAAKFRVGARLRYRIDSGDLLLSYKLERPADVLREAFSSVVGEIEAGLEIDAYRGSR